MLYAPSLPAAGSPARLATERDLLHFDPVFPSLGVKGAALALSGPTGDPLLAGRDGGELIDAALASAWRAVTARRGADPAAWAVATAPHVFGVLSYAGVPQSGPGSVLRLPTFMNRGTANDRIVFRRGRADYCDVTPPGQSSFVAPDGSRSPHFADQLALYASFGCKHQLLMPTEVLRRTTETHRFELRGAPVYAPRAIAR